MSSSPELDSMLDVEPILKKKKKELMNQEARGTAAVSEVVPSMGIKCEIR